MLALGYLGLYTWPVAVVITLPFVILSYAPACAAGGDFYRALAATRKKKPENFSWLLPSLAGTAFVVSLLVKGLYPDGGHDYFTHYFYYLHAAIGYSLI